MSQTTSHDPASSSPTTPNLLEHIAALFAEGKIESALHSILQGLAIEPTNPDLYNLAGVCTATMGNLDQAEQYWLQTIELVQSAPYATQVHFNLAQLYSDSKRYELAEQSYRQVLALDTGHAQATAKFGFLLAQQGRATEAEHYYRQALTLFPNDAATHSNLGLLCAAQHRHAEAENAYRQAIAITPDNSAIHSNLGILLTSMQRYQEAEQSYHQALRLAPEKPETWSNLGLLLALLQRNMEAEQCHRHALGLHAGHPGIHINLANLLMQIGRNIDAEQAYRQAIALRPEAATAHSNLGVLLSRQKREEEAEQSFRQAIAANPHYPLARMNLAFLLLTQGRLHEGWYYHEARYDPALPEPDVHLLPLPFPQWQGQSLAGKTLLLWLEQGLGDEIQFCRYVPLLKAQGATRITVVCKPSSAALLTTLEGVDNILTLPQDADTVPVHDYWAFSMSVPLHYGTTLHTIPAQIPYLHAPLERRQAWSAAMTQESLGGLGSLEGFHRRLRIGLVWKGNRKHANDGYRSLPGLATLAALWSVDQAHFISLQKGTGEEDAQHPPPGQPLLHLGSGIHDMADTAAIVEQLDLLICVDTAVAHLAGALGKPCWVMLPARQTDWRWMKERNDSPWYPTMRLFRQGEHESWTDVVQRLAKALRAIQ